MSSEAFIVSGARAKDASDAIRLAVEKAGVKPARVEEALFISEGSASRSEGTEAVRGAGLTCPSVSISSALRAICFAGQSILSGDVEVDVVVGVSEQAAAIVLAGSEAIGRWNLMPRARLAARSLSGGAPAMSAAGIAADEVTVTKDGDSVMLVVEALDELETQQGRWAVVRADATALLIERV